MFVITDNLLVLVVKAKHGLQDMKYSYNKTYEYEAEFRGMRRSNSDFAFE